MPRVWCSWSTLPHRSYHRWTQWTYNSLNVWPGDLESNVLHQHRWISIILVYNWGFINEDGFLRWVVTVSRSRLDTYLWASILPQRGLRWQAQLCDSILWCALFLFYHEDNTAQPSWLVQPQLSSHFSNGPWYATVSCFPCFIASSFYFD